MSQFAPVEVTVYPDDCDSYGHLNQGAFARLFERARWDVLSRGAGRASLEHHNVWPALRKATIEFKAQVYPGDRLRFDLALREHGRTSMTFRQTARRMGSDTEVLVAEGEFVMVCIDTEGRQAAVPQEVVQALTLRASRRTGATQYFTVGDVTLAVDAIGDGGAVLFIHGFPLDRTMWKQVAGTLTGWRRIMPDLRGAGLSEAPEGGYTMAAYADDMVALLEKLHVDRAVVCGLSMGGYVAFELLRRHPDRVRALILANTRAEPDDSAGREKRDQTIARVHRDGVAFLADDMMPRLLASESLKAMPDLVEQLREMIRAGRPPGIAGALAAMRDRPDSAPLLSSISVPTLVLAGAEDQLIPPATARAMADAIPGAQLAMVPHAGHLAPMEQPVNTGRFIAEFLNALP